MDDRHQPVRRVPDVGPQTPLESFTVGSVTGCPITPATLADPRNGRERTIWYVYDRAYCFEIVGEFRNVGRMGGGVVTGEQRARELAARLNKEDPWA